MANLSPSPKLQFFDANGNPLAGGKLYTYAAGTTTPLATYTDASTKTPNANPIILDSRGEANVWLGPSSYKFKLTTSTNVDVWTINDISSPNKSYDVLVTDFGAIGDFDGVSGTDNTKSFQDALNFVAPQGGRVRVPGGLLNKYYFATQSGANPSLSIPSNVEIAIDNDVCLYTAGGVASGVDAYNVVGSNKKALFVNSNPTSGNVNIAITGGKIKCIANSAIGQTHIAFKNVKKVLVRDVTLLDSWGACRAQFSYCQDVTIDTVQVAFENAHAAPFVNEQGIRIGSGCSNVSITNTSIESGNEALVVTNTATETNTAITSIVKYPYASTGASISEVIFNNGSLTTKNGAAISVTQGVGMTTGSINPLSFGYFVAKAVYPTTSWGSAVFVKDYNSSSIPSAIGGVVFSNFGVDGSQLGTSGTGTPAAVDIASNVTGVMLTSGSVVGVTVSHCVKFGQGAVVNAIEVSGAQNSGFVVDGTGCRIVNSRAQYSGDYGIRLTSNAFGTVINGNRVDYAGVACIKDDSGILTVITGNDFYNSPAPIFPTNPNNVVFSNNNNPVNPACSVYKAGTQSISDSTWTKVSLDTKEFDTNSNFNTSTSRWQPTIPGYYQINAAFSTNTSISLTACQAALYKQGSSFKVGPYITGTTCSASVSAVVYMNGSTNYLELYAFINASTPVISGGFTLTYFTACLL